MNTFNYTPAKNSPIDSDELLSDIKRAAEKKGSNTLTQKQYSELGKYDVTNISRRFGTWRKALSKAGLEPGNVNNYADEELFENILCIWEHIGKQPTRRDLSQVPSKISQSPYNRRFDTWSQALQAFIEYIESNEIQYDAKDITVSVKTKKTNRDPSLRLRFLVLKRDNFSCKQCGSSPAKNSAVELHIDHIIPWSKGGETTLENLQTLCLKCNLGKSNLE